MSEQGESQESSGLNGPLYCPKCDYGLDDRDCICHLIGARWNAELPDASSGQRIVETHTKGE